MNLERKDVKLIQNRRLQAPEKSFSIFIVSHL